jgi:tetratricopeptide (TPR) repeat protein
MKYIRLLYIRLLYTAPLLVVLASCSTDPKVRSNNDVKKGNGYYERGRTKEASIMYRHALQKNLKNIEAWYKLGLINLGNGALGEGRGDMIRVVDLGTEEKKFDEKVQDALTRVADIDYTGYARYPEKLKSYFADLKTRADLLQQHYPNTFEAHRILALAKYAEVVGLKKRDERRPIVEEALAEFKKADAVKPYDPSMGFAIVSTLAELGQREEAERYANEMIARKTADERVYSSLYWGNLGSGRISEAEQIRKTQIANTPKDGGAYVALASHYFLTKNKAQMEATLARLTSDLKTFPNAYMLVGDFYFSIGDLLDSIGPYTQGAKLDPQNKNLYLKKAAEAYSLVGKYDDAGRIVADLMKTDPNDSEVIAMDASLQLNHAKREDADNLIQRLQPLLAKVASNEPERSMILHFNLGRAYALKGDTQSLDQARVQFEEAVAARKKDDDEATRRPPYIPALMALAQLELQRGGNPQALDYINSVIQYDPANLTARLMRTMALMNMGEGEKARKELQDLLSKKPDSLDARFQLGRLNMMQKKFAEADKEFETIKSANDPRGLLGLIDSKIAQGNPDEAMQMIKAELAKQPGNTNYRNALANLYFSNAKYTEAAAEFKTLVDQSAAADVGSRELWYLRLGESLRHANDISGAIGAFNKAGEIAPKHSTPRLELAMLYDTADRKEDARMAYEEVLKMEPDNPIALNNLAYFKANSGTDLNTALTFATRARQKAPQDPNVQDTLALIYYKKDLTDDSLRILSDLGQKYPSNPTYHLHLAMVLFKKGESARARKELSTASRNSPSASEQAQIKELLSKLG